MPEPRYQKQGTTVFNIRMFNTGSSSTGTLLIFKEIIIDIGTL